MPSRCLLTLIAQEIVVQENAALLVQHLCAGWEAQVPAEAVLAGMG